MTTRTRKAGIRVPDPPIRGTLPPPRQVQGGGIPPLLPAPPRVEAPPIAAPAQPVAPPPIRTTPGMFFASAVTVGALPTIAAPAPLGRMKNSELRGKIAKLERENRALAERLVTLTHAALAVMALLDELETYDDQPAGLRTLAHQLREALK